MRTRYTIFSYAVLMLVCNIAPLTPPLFAQDLTTNVILEKIARLAEATGRYHAEFTVVTEKNGISKTAIGQMKYKWPNKSWREIKRQRDGALMGLVISNGTIKWNYIPSAQLALKYDLGAINKDAQEKGWGSAAELDEASLEYVGIEQLDGESVYVLEGISSDLLKHHDPDEPEKVRVYIGVEDGIIRKTVTYNAHGRELGSQTFLTIQRDLSIADKDFEFSPPEGTKIYEMKDIGSPPISPH